VTKTARTATMHDPGTNITTVMMRDTGTERKDSNDAIPWK